MIETKTSAQVNEFAIVENIFGSHLKAVAKAEDKKHFAIMEGNEILTPFELESHGIAFNGVVLLKAGDKMGMLAFDLGNIYIAPEYDYINEAAVGDDFVFEKDGKKGRVTLRDSSSLMMNLSSCLRTRRMNGKISVSSSPTTLINLIS